GDSAVLSASLFSILTQPGQCEAWGANCRARIIRDFSLSLQTRRYSSLYERVCASGSDARMAPSLSDAPINGDAGARLQANRSRLLLASLEHFAGTTKRVSAAQREVCCELIRCLREQCANPATGDDPGWQRTLVGLQTGLMAHEADRQARETEHRRRNLARREVLAGLFRKRGSRIQPL